MERSTLAKSRDPNQEQDATILENNLVNEKNIEEQKDGLTLR